MNCARGDLALSTAHCGPDFSERLYEVCDPAFPTRSIINGPHWHVLPLGWAPPLDQVTPNAKGQIVVPDAWLRPIRPQADDAVDEMVRLVGAAPKTLTEVREVSHG